MLKTWKCQCQEWLIEQSSKNFMEKTETLLNANTYNKIIYGIKATINKL